MIEIFCRHSNYSVVSVSVVINGVHARLEILFNQVTLMLSVSAVLFHGIAETSFKSSFQSKRARIT